jgi:hypothetical protein
MAVAFASDFGYALGVCRWNYETSLQNAPGAEGRGAASHIST